MLISMVVYTLVPVQSFAMRLAARVAFLPVIAGVSFELIRFAARRQGSLWASLVQPGLWLQRITTRPPSDDQLEVSIRALDEAMAQGKDLVLDIDVQGAGQLKSRLPEAVTIFILAPSRQVLEQRLRARSEDTDAVIERRLRDAAQEIRNYSLYDYVVINKDLDQSAETLEAIVRAERARRTRIEDQIRPILATFEKDR